MYIAKNTRTDSGPRDPETAPTHRAWSAPVAAAPVRARLELPGSKSLTNRELVLSALASGTSVLRRTLKSRDSELMLRALETLGVTVRELDGADSAHPDLELTPPGELTGAVSIDCGLAGTVMRFLPPVAALALGPVYFDGDPYARKRPMLPLLTALQALGTDIAAAPGGQLPFTVYGTGRIAGGRVEIDASKSSQFVSGLLLAAARFDTGLEVVHTGEKLPSLPHIEMTIAALKERGVTVANPARGRWQVAPGSIAARDVTIEPDLSNAAPFLAAALVSGGSVTVANWPSSTTQVGDQLQHLLPAFGARVTLADGDLTVTGDGSIKPVELNLSAAGELAPTLIGLAALADGDSVISGIGHIRHHETDRIAALVREINRLGGDASELKDGITIRRARLHGGTWRSYADHRMATTGALIGLKTPGVTVDDIASTSKTMPDFVPMWQRLVTESEHPGDTA